MSIYATNLISEHPIIGQTPGEVLDGETAILDCSSLFGAPIINLTEVGDEMFPKMAVYYKGEQLLDGEYNEFFNPPGILPSQINEVGLGRCKTVFSPRRIGLSCTPPPLKYEIWKIFLLIFLHDIFLIKNCSLFALNNLLIEGFCSPLW